MSFSPKKLFTPIITDWTNKMAQPIAQNYEYCNNTIAFCEQIFERRNRSDCQSWVLLTLTPKMSLKSVVDLTIKMAQSKVRIITTIYAIYLLTHFETRDDSASEFLSCPVVMNTKETTNLPKLVERY